MRTAFLLAVVLVAGAQAQTIPALNGTAAIRGRVIDATGQPVSRATLQVSTASGPGIPLGAPRSGARISRITVTAANDGHFVVAQLPAGPYQIIVLKNGFLSSPVERVVTLGEVDIVDLGDVVLRKPAVVAGRVLDEGGGPVEGAFVEALGLRYQNGRTELVAPGNQRRLEMTAVTNDLGQYRIHGLEPGRYVVSARLAPEHAAVPLVLDLRRYPRSFYPSSLNAAGAQQILLEAGMETSGSDIVLNPARTASISGVALDSDGRPFRGSITLRTSRRANQLVVSWPEAPATPDGSFEFTSVPPGDYVIQAAAPLGAAGEASFASEYVTVSGPDISGLRLRASEGTSVTGRLTVEGGTSGLAPWQFEVIPGPTDLDLSPQVNPIYKGTLRDDWTFDLKGLSGPRLFRAVYTGGGAWNVKAVFADGVEVTDTPLALGGGKRAIRDLEIVVSDAGGTIAGTVERSGGRTAAIAFSTDPSRWHPHSRFVATARPRPDGTFAIAGLPPGSYFVAASQVENDALGGAWQAPDLLEALSTSALRVSLLERQRALVLVRVQEGR